MDQAAQELITHHNEQMRELIVRDIDALEDKLNVKRQVSRRADIALDKVKGTLGMNDRTQSEGVAGFVRQNAAPLAAVGLGGAVLARNLRERVSDDTGTQSDTTRLVTESSYVPYPGTSRIEADGGSSMKDRASDKVGEVQSAASEQLDTAKEKVSDVADTAKAKVTGAKDTVSEQAVHAKDVVVERVPSREQAKRAAHDHSQLLGLAALAAGAVAGTFVPRSRAEERRLAPVQAQVKEKASDLVDTGVEKAKETADRAAEAVSVAAETAKEEFAESGDDQPPSDLPDVTRSNRITGSSGTRTGAATGVDGTTSSY